MLSDAAIVSVDHRLVSVDHCFDHRCLRHIARINWLDFVTKESVRNRCGIKDPLSATMMLRRWRWIGHVMRMPRPIIDYSDIFIGY